MIQSLGRAVVDLADRRLLAIMLQAIIVSLATFIILAGLLVWMLRGFNPCTVLDLGSCQIDTGESILVGTVFTLVAVWFLFPAVAITVLSGFGDRVAAVVEQLHYPDAARSAHAVGIAQGVRIGLNSATRLIAFNLLAMPLYLLLLVTGVGAFILFVIVNGIVLGRDFAELAAARHGDRSSRQAWLKQSRAQQHFIGLVVSVLFLVPFANLLAPVIGTAAAIHLFNRSFWRTTNSSADPAL